LYIYKANPLLWARIFKNIALAILNSFFYVIFCFPLDLSNQCANMPSFLQLLWTQLPLIATSSFSSLFLRRDENDHSILYALMETSQWDHFIYGNSLVFFPKKALSSHYVQFLLSHPLLNSFNQVSFLPFHQICLC
jgi:hypothetical protein